MNKKMSGQHCFLNQLWQHLLNAYGKLSPKKLLAMLAFALTLPFAAVAEDVSYPLFNPNLMSFFGSETQWILARSTNDTDNVNFVHYESLGFFDDNKRDMRIGEFTLGFIIPVSKHIGIPLFGSWLIGTRGSSADADTGSNIRLIPYIGDMGRMIGVLYGVKAEDYFESFWGSGIVFNTDILAGGLYAGYHEVINDKWGEDSSGAFDYAIVPVFKADEIQWLKKALKSVEGLFSTGRLFLDDSKNNSKDMGFVGLLRFVSRDFELGDIDWHIAPYVYHGNYDWETKTTNYGIKLAMDWFSLDGGYRTFDVDSYTNNFFGSVYVEPQFDNFSFPLRVLVDRYSLPKVSIGFRFDPDSAFTMWQMFDFAWSQDGAFTASFTLRFFGNVDIRD